MLTPSPIYVICRGRSAPCALHLAFLMTFFNNLFTSTIHRLRFCPAHKLGMVWKMRQQLPPAVFGSIPQTGYWRDLKV